MVIGARARLARVFRAPWVYSVVEDIFVRHEPLRSVDTLTWEIATHDDEYGETYELLELFSVPLDDAAARQGLALFDNDHWSAVKRALGSPLFETPVAHFFVRAFLSQDIDEFVAHMTTIEAGLGLHADYDAELRPKTDPHKNRGATSRLRARIAALLDDSSAACLHKRLFDTRSSYHHGRAMEPRIPKEQRTEARTLARRVAEALVRASAPTSRDEFLSRLLDRGALMPTAPPAGRA